MTRTLSTHLRALAVLSSLLVAPFVSAATGATAPVISAGELTYGTAATFAPFEFQSNGKLTGFDIDLMFGPVHGQLHDGSPWQPFAPSLAQMQRRKMPEWDLTQ